MADTIPKLREEAIKILQEDYPKIKEGMYRLEVFMRRKSRKAVYELRDFLDHLASIFREDITLETAQAHICECRTHLRRCAVEPLEYMAERRFVKLDFYATCFSRMPFIKNNPTTKPEFFQGMKEIKNLIAEGRASKTEGKACEMMDKAFGITTDLLSQVHPVSFVIQGLFWITGVFITGLVAAFLAIYFSNSPCKKSFSNPPPNNIASPVILNSSK